MAGSRSGGRRGRQASNAEPDERSSRYRQLRNPFAPARILSDDQVESIHRSALRVLTEYGIKVLEPESRSIFASFGAEVEESTQMVHFEPSLVESAMATCPSEFWMRSRGRLRDVHVGGDSVAFLPVAGPPHAMDLERGRRTGTLDDYVAFVKLAQTYDVIHALAPSVEPQDVALEERHLQLTLPQIIHSDKVPFIYARGRGGVLDCFEMFQIAWGMDQDEFVTEPRCWSVINTNSPRQLDIPMCEGIIDFARYAQPLVITPFTLAGAMAPVTLAGALTLQHAEALAAIALAQMVRPGTPIVYGAFTSNVDMRSGAPAFGTPEAFKASIASGQLARFLGVPWRSSGVNTSNAPDAQGGYETMINMMGALQGGSNFIIHAAGWLESGLSASYEKFVLDIEMLQILAEVMQPMDVSETEIALDAISDVDPGGHFFGTAHTLARYRSAFYEPHIFDRSNFEQWTEDGSQTSMQRATNVWKSALESFQPPTIDETVVDELNTFVAQRIAEGGVAPGGSSPRA